MAAAATLTEQDMGSLMAPFEPFEPAPRIAVALSGGADSMALTVLLKDWANTRKSSITGLIVDHGLRPGSAAEARQTASWLQALGLDSHILTWRGPKPRSGRQAAARAARYDLLCAWCRRHGVLHLATGHHQDDQAETLLLRLGRSSGLSGLAGMPPVRELESLRLLRPLLPISRARLEATLRARGLCWIEDPANRDAAYTRARLRLLRPGLDALGLTAPRLAAAAGQLGRARRSLERRVASVLASAVVPDPAGFAWLEPARLLSVDPEAGERALARVLMAVGGTAYAPRLERLRRLYARLAKGLGRGATLGGCRIVPRRGRLLVAREPTAAPSVPVRPGERLRWDARFDVVVGRSAARARGPLVLAALGERGWAELSGGLLTGDSSRNVPAVAAVGLPALSDRHGLLSVPQLGYGRGPDGGAALKKCDFAPENPLVGPRFTVA